MNEHFQISCASRFTLTYVFVFCFRATTRIKILDKDSDYGLYPNQATGVVTLGQGLLEIAQEVRAITAGGSRLVSVALCGLSGGQLTDVANALGGATRLPTACVLGQQDPQVNVVPLQEDTVVAVMNTPLCVISPPQSWTVCPEHLIVVPSVPQDLNRALQCLEITGLAYPGAKPTLQVWLSTETTTATRGKAYAVLNEDEEESESRLLLEMERKKEEMLSQCGQDEEELKVSLFAVSSWQILTCIAFLDHHIQRGPAEAS